MAASAGAGASGNGGVPELSMPGAIEMDFGVQEAIKQEEGDEVGLATPASPVTPSATTPRSRAVASSRPADDDDLGTDAEHDDDDDDDMPSTQRLSNLSMSARWPADKKYTPVVRMKGTINTYAVAIAAPKWFERFKQPTVRALRQRFLHYAPELSIVSDVEVQIAYKQLVSRVTALMKLYKMLCYWTASQKGKDLPNILRPLACLSLFLERAGQTLAPDLQMLKMWALFNQALTDGSTLADALAHIDMDLLRQCQQAMLQYEIAHPPKPQETIKAELDDDATAAAAEVPDPSSFDPGDDGKTKKPAKQKKVITHLMCDFLSEPDAQLFSILVEPLRLRIHRLPKSVTQDSTAINELIEEFDDIDMALVRIMGEEAACKSELVRFVRSTRCLAACSSSQEVNKPSTDEVRRARKNIIALSEGNSTGAELGIVMGTFAGAKALMAKAKDHCAGCLADQNATEMYSVAAARFEKGMGAAFDDLEGWLMKGNAGAPHDCNSFRSVMAMTSNMAVDTLNSLSMWSTVALRRQVENLSNFISVGMEVARLWIIVEARAVNSALRVACSSMGMPFADGANQDAQPAATELAPTKDESLSTGVGEESGVAELAMMSDGKDGPLQADGDTPISTVAHPNGAAPLQVALSALLEGADNMRSLVEAVGKCYDISKQRAGSRFTDVVEDRCLPGVVKSDCETAFESLHNLVKYMICAFLLQKSQVDDLLNFGCVLDLRSDHFDCLATFCKAHKHHIRRALTIVDMQFDPIVPFSSVARPLTAMFNDFVDNSGRHIFDAHATKSMNFWLQEILNNKVAINAVRNERLNEMTPEHMLPLLVPSPPVEKLVPQVPVSLDGDPNNQSVEDLPHNRALKMLLTFAERVGFLDITIPGVHLPEKQGDQPLPLDIASFVLSTVCVSIDCCIFAAMLHHHLLKPMCDSEGSTATIAPADPLGNLTDALFALNNRLMSLDSLARSCNASDFEKAGYQSTFIQIVTITSWGQSMSAFAKRVEHLLMTSWSEVLRNAIKQTREVCPAWEAAFENFDYHSSLAEKILAGKVKTFVNSHNRLHSMLTKATASATQLGISPRLAEHELTCEVIAIASSALVSLKTGAMISQGVDILKNFKNHPNGSEYARTFIDKHKAGAPSSVPTSFWQQFESLAAHASLSGPTSTMIETKAKNPPTMSLGRTSTASASSSTGASAASISTTTISSSGEANAGLPTADAATGEPPQKLRRLVKKTSS